MKKESTDAAFSGAPAGVTLMTLDPGHFHAALVQKYRNPQIDSAVYIFAPEGPDLEGHLSRIEAYNRRAEDPTNWHSTVYSGADFLERMLRDKPGNVVVLSGNNARKMEYIQASVNAGINVLADKPMAIRPADFMHLQDVFAAAEKNGVLVYDIMTERYEITTILQKTLAQIPELFGELEKGTPADPAITKESVHHFSKIVSGSPLLRPAWFFDVEQQGEGIVDVSTHLVDLVFWECFPEQSIDYRQDIELLQARRWATLLSPAQFRHVTGLAAYPPYLDKDVIQDSLLQVFSNGEISFRVKGVHAKVSVIWNYEAPPGSADTHYSIMRGTLANLVIRQEAEENFRPVLYIEPVGAGSDIVREALAQSIEKLADRFPGLSFKPAVNGFELLIPEEYKVGHEAHFAQVTDRYLQYLAEGKLPEWEVPNMLAKYYVTTKAYELSRQ